MSGSLNSVVKVTITEHKATPPNLTLNETDQWSIAVMPEQNKQTLENAPAESLPMRAIDAGGSGASCRVLSADATGLVTAGVREQTTTAKLGNNGRGNNSRIISNASTRFTDNSSTPTRLWAPPASGTGSFNQVVNGSAVPGAQQYNCMRAEDGGLYNVRMDGIGVLFCGRIDSSTDSQAARRRFFGMEVGLQFAWKLPSSNSWSSWLDVRSGADQTATVRGVANTLLCDFDKAYGVTSPGTIESDNASNRLISFFKTKFFSDNDQNTPYYADVAPPFWLAFGIGANQLFPQTDLDYRFRLVFAAMNGNIDSQQAFIQVIYNYTEQLVAKRIN